MDLFASAPLAPLEFDSLSVDDDTSTEKYYDSQTLMKRVQSIPFDLCGLSGFGDSLSELIENFDEKIYNCLEISKDKIDIVEEKKIKTNNLINLNDVKFWWSNTENARSEINYPFDQFPVTVNLYDTSQFEMADVDGISEDNILNDNENAGEEIKDSSNIDAYSSCVVVHGSNRGTVTSISETSSLRSCSADLNEFVPDSSPVHQCIDSFESSDRLSKPQFLSQTDLELDQFQKRHIGLTLTKTQAWQDDLHNLSIVGLNLYANRLQSQIMDLSNSLVEYLANRDDMLMLHEASDDFIILLHLVHERRAQASKAALLLTAQNLLRSRLKAFSRLSTPWFNKGSQHESKLSVGLTNKTNRVMHHSSCSTNSSAHLNGGYSELYLDSKCKVAHYVHRHYLPNDKLNLDSKLRRPCVQSIQTKNQSKPVGVLPHIYQPLEKQHNDDDDDDNNEEETHLLVKPLQSNKQTKMRYEALVNLCKNVAWPNGKPQCSRSLSLRLLYRTVPDMGVSFHDLRQLNQILYATLLENSNVTKLVETYLKNVSSDNNIMNWVQLVGHSTKSCEVHQSNGTPSTFSQMDSFQLFLAPAQCV